MSTRDAQASEEIALSPEDRAILDLECPTVVGHTGKVVVLGPEAIDARLLRDRVADRLPAAPELRYRLSGTVARPTWSVLPELDLEAHVVDRAGAPVEPAALPGVVADLFSRHLDRDRPLWAIDVVPLVGGATALVWRLHHALADGATSVRLARAVLWDAPPAGAGEPASVAGGPTPHAAPSPSAVAVDRARRARLRGFLRREFAFQVNRSPFDGTIGTRREVAFAACDLRALHAAARSTGATVNDAVLSTVAGALRSWLVHRGDRLHDLRVRVPVSLHRHEGDALNHDSWFTVPLPLHLDDPVLRLRAVRRLTAACKDGDDAARLDTLLRGRASASPRLRRWIDRVQAGPREFAVSVSNVVGPRHPVSLLGREVRAVWGVAEIGQRHALRVGAYSVGDTLSFGFCADPTIVGDLPLLAVGLEHDVDRLLRATGER